MAISFDAINAEILASGPLTAYASGWYFGGFTLHMLSMGIVMFMELMVSKVTNGINFKGIFVLGYFSLSDILRASLVQKYPFESNLIKYCGWLIVTPVMACQFCELLDGKHVVAWVVLLDLFVMVTGFLGWILGASTSLRWMLFGISCLAQVIMFGLVGVMFYENDILLKASGFNKERRMYQVVLALFLVCWSTYGILWAQTYEGGAKNGYGEDYLAAGSVILTFFCKDVSQILISYINACFSARLQDLQEKEKKNVVMDDKSAAMHISNVNFIQARLSQKGTFFEVLEQDNPDGTQIFSSKKMPIMTSAGKAKPAARPSPLAKH